MGFHVLVFISSTLYASTPTTCIEKANEILTAPKAAPGTPTDRVIGYLGELFENRALSETELGRFLEALERDRLANPIRDEDAELDVKRSIHREGLQKLFQRGGLDLERLKKWTRKVLATRSTIQSERDQARGETQEVRQVLKFVRVQPGQFKMGNAHKKFTAILTRSFDVAATPLTQKQWVDLMGENPAKFAKGEHSTTVMVGGKEIQMQPDNPIENVTWWSAAAYANKLSEMYGYEPVYDFSKVNFKKNTRAEDGTLEAERGDPEINAPDGDIYQAEGFRLPTEAEQQYLLLSAGKTESLYYFGDNESDLKEHAWYAANANGTTHPVAELKPLILDGNSIYDLHGNVSEWSHDNFGSLPSGVVQNPTRPYPGGSSRVYVGGSWKGGTWELRSRQHGGSHPNTRDDDVGFRLVRSR